VRNHPNNALEPFIDARTMELHHDRHHALFVNNLNTIAKDHPQIGDALPHVLLDRLSTLPDSIRATASSWSKDLFDIG
jgi:Fe-Mn family superoxide dismutase